jgi:hypothetical protein
MRTQIALNSEQHARAKQKAASLGITLAEYIRRLVDDDLAGVEPQASPATVTGIGASGGGDIEREGKHAVAEAVADRMTSTR